MSLNDYKELYEAIVHMSVDIEDSVPRAWEPPVLADTLMIYGYVREMIECLNDVPKSLIERAEKEGIYIPEINPGL